MSHTITCQCCNAKVEIPKHGRGKPRVNPDHLVTSREASANYYAANKEEILRKHHEKHAAQKLAAAQALIAKNRLNQMNA